MIKELRDDTIEAMIMILKQKHYDIYDIPCNISDMKKNEERMKNIKDAIDTITLEFEE